MKILLCIVLILIGASFISLLYELRNLKNVTTKSKLLSISIPINHRTNIAYSANYISFNNNILKACNLEGYVKFLSDEHEKYLKTNFNESFQQYLDRKYPTKKN